MEDNLGALQHGGEVISQRGRISYQQFYSRHLAVGDQVVEEDEGPGLDDAERLRAQVATCAAFCKGSEDFFTQHE